MKKLGIAITVLSICLCACGSGDTGDSYPADRSGLNEEAGDLDSSMAPMAGTRGNPENTIGGDTILNTRGREIEAPAPDEGATNQNIGH